VFQNLPVNYIPGPEFSNEEGIFEHTLEGKIKLDKDQIALRLTLDLAKPINTTNYAIVADVVNNLRHYRQRSLQFLLDEHETRKSEPITDFITHYQEECVFSKVEATNNIILREIEFFPQYPNYLLFAFGFRGKCDCIIVLKWNSSDQISFSDYFDIYD
jgi:hypothetical protein